MQATGARAGRAAIPLLVLLVMLTLITFSVRNWLATQRAGEQQLVVSGTVEARYSRVASQIGGRISELPVQEGEQLAAGQLIASTDPLELPLQISQAELSIKAARSDLLLLAAGPTQEELAASRHRSEAAWQAYESLQQGSRPEDIAAAESAVAQARTQLEDARDELRRLELLYQAATVEERQVVAARARIEQLREAVAAAEARLELLQNGPRDSEIEQARQQAEAARSDYQRLQRGARDEELSAAQSRIEALEAGRDALQLRLDESAVLAPAAGEIVNLPVSLGDTVAPGQTICELLLPDSTYIQSFIPEDRLAWISVGTQLEYSLDGVAGNSLATVSWISPEAEFTPRNLQTTQKRVEQVYRVKLDPGEMQQLRPGLICDILIPAPEQPDGTDG
ncbi:MAG: HlyD family efflux transporter periplasmic adaptor subunit [bacterium]